MAVKSAPRVDPPMKQYEFTLPVSTPAADVREHLEESARPDLEPNRVAAEAFDALARRHEAAALDLSGWECPECRRIVFMPESAVRYAAASDALDGLGHPGDSL